MPRHEERKIVKNTVVFTGAMLAQKLLSFLYFFYLSSRMSPGTLGGYVWALSFTTLFSIGTDLGLAPVFTREASRRVEDGNKLLRNALALKLPLIAITAILALLTVTATGGSGDRIFLVLGAIGVMSLDALALIFWGSLRARQNIFYESISIILFQIVVFGSGVIFWETTHKIVFVMAALTLGSFSNVVIAAVVLKFKFGYKLAPAWDKDVISHFIRTARSFALAGIFVKIYNAADSVLLGYLKGEHDVGIYSIPAKVVTALQALIPGAFAASIFPSMSNYFVTSREKLSSVFSKSFSYLLLFAAPIGIGLATIAKPVLAALWPDYIEAVPAFVVMGIGLPFVFLAFSTGSLLNAANEEKKSTVHRGIITGINVALNLAFIPFWGPLGAAMAFLAANIILLILDLRAVKKIIIWDKNINLYTIKIFASAATMGIFVSLFGKTLPIPITVASGIIIYVVGVILLRAVTKNDLKMIVRMLKKSEKRLSESSEIGEAL